MTLNKILTPTLLALFTLIAVGQWASADEHVGKKWPAAQRVAFDQIDHRTFDQLLKKYVDANGMVDYQAWHASAADRASLTQYLHELGKADADKQATQPAKLAYWINAYNALTIEGILRVYPTTSIRNHTAKVFGYNIWKNLKLISGAQEITLDHIEHKILRPLGEPRIHFAIVCASIGCPRLLNEAYAADRLEQQLVTNTTDFFSRSQNLRVDAANKKLHLSSIISWFGADFGKDQSAQLTYLARYFPVSAQKFAAAGGYRVAFQTYDWNLNAQKK
ncbi:MAG: hypothetical protein ACI87E_004063 [Mariniblastus sp.]|jgi:hypothetical protein